MNMFKRAPKTEVEAQALTRWMNMNLRVLNENMKRLRDREDIPSYVFWEQYPKDDNLNSNDFIIDILRNTFMDIIL